MTWQSWVAHPDSALLAPAPGPTGPIPASLATQHNLGVLSLGNNRLSGDLTAFATALKDPEELAAANNTKAVSRLFDFNVTNNGLVGSLPDNLAWLGIFNPVITILVPGADGSAAVAPRVLDISWKQVCGTMASMATEGGEGCGWELVHRAALAGHEDLSDAGMGAQYTGCRGKCRVAGALHSSSTCHGHCLLMV